MASSFFVTLPSTTPGTNGRNNLNKFRVQLPEPLIFDRGNWQVGLHSIIYPHSWDSLGTINEQFVDIVLKSGRKIRAPVPRGTFHSAEVLAAALRTTIPEEYKKTIRHERKKRSTREDDDSSSPSHIRFKHPHFAVDYLGTEGFEAEVYAIRYNADKCTLTGFYHGDFADSEFDNDMPIWDAVDSQLILVGDVLDEFLGANPALKSWFGDGKRYGSRLFIGAPPPDKIEWLREQMEQLGKARIDDYKKRFYDAMQNLTAIGESEQAEEDGGGDNPTQWEQQLALMKRLGYVHDFCTWAQKASHEQMPRFAANHGAEQRESTPEYRPLWYGIYETAGKRRLTLEPICVGSEIDSEQYGTEIIGNGGKGALILNLNAPTLESYANKCTEGLLFAVNAPVSKNRLREALIEAGASIDLAPLERQLARLLKEKEKVECSLTWDANAEQLTAWNDAVAAISMQIEEVEDQRNAIEWALDFTGLTLNEISAKRALREHIELQENLVNEYADEIAELKRELERYRTQIAEALKCEVPCPSTIEIMRDQKLSYRYARRQRRRCLLKSVLAGETLIAKIRSLVTACDTAMEDASLSVRQKTYQMVRKNLLNDSIISLYHRIEREKISIHAIEVEEEEPNAVVVEETSTTVPADAGSVSARSKRSAADGAAIRRFSPEQERLLATFRLKSTQELLSEVSTHTNELKRLNPLRDAKQAERDALQKQINAARERRAPTSEIYELSERRTASSEAFQDYRNQINSILDVKKLKEHVLAERRQQEENQRLEAAHRALAERARQTAQANADANSRAEAARLEKERVDAEAEQKAQEDERRAAAVVERQQKAAAERQSLEKAEQKRRDEAAKDEAAKQQQQHQQQMEYQRQQQQHQLHDALEKQERARQLALKEKPSVVIVPDAPPPRPPPPTPTVNVNTSELLPIVEAVEFAYLPAYGRFQLRLHHRDIDYLMLTAQMKYMLGFEESKDILRNGDIAKYAYDLRGGISHFCVNTPGLAENMIVGDKQTPTLRVVTVKGKPGDVLEEVYDSPIFTKVVTRHVDGIDVEIRTLQGDLVPFDYGVVIVTLVFKKLLYL